MAKKKTGGIPRKLPPVGTTQRPKRELPGKTIPERFRALEDLFPGPVPKREVAGFLSQENHRASTRSRRKQTTDLGPECSELLQYLLNNYGKTYVAMACREAPFLMETGFNYLEEIHDTDHLTEEQCNRANVLGNFVMNIRADRVCTARNWTTSIRIWRKPSSTPCRRRASCCCAAPPPTAAMRLSSGSG